MRFPIAFMYSIDRALTIGPLILMTYGQCQFYTGQCKQTANSMYGSTTAGLDARYCGQYASAKLQCL